ncbi:MAG TPA: hypothetical protein PLF35_08535, partial [Prolixibacteraceae bacterium]|nr:hypothetical protein [Prolixibacteraceae bacterium]
DTCRNPVDCMLFTFKNLSVYFRDHSPVFIGDLQRLYPEMVSDKHTSGYGQFREKIIQNIQRGIAEGVYRNDIDEVLISKYLVHSIFGYFFHSVIFDNTFSAANYFDTIAQFNLRALINDKGMELLIKSQI